MRRRDWEGPERALVFVVSGWINSHTFWKCFAEGARVSEIMRIRCLLTPGKIVDFDETLVIFKFQFLDAI